MDLCMLMQMYRQVHVFRRLSTSHLLGSAGKPGGDPGTVEVALTCLYGTLIPTCGDIRMRAACVGHLLDNGFIFQGPYSN